MSQLLNLSSLLLQCLLLVGLLCVARRTVPGHTAQQFRSLCWAVVFSDDVQMKESFGRLSETQFVRRCALLAADQEPDCSVLWFAPLTEPCLLPDRIGYGS